MKKFSKLYYEVIEKSIFQKKFEKKIWKKNLNIFLIPTEPSASLSAIHLIPSKTIKDPTSFANTLYMDKPSIYGISEMISTWLWKIFEIVSWRHRKIGFSKYWKKMDFFFEKNYNLLEFSTVSHPYISYHQRPNLDKPSTYGISEMISTWLWKIFEIVSWRHRKIDFSKKNKKKL